MGNISYKMALIDFVLTLANQNFHLNDGGGGRGLPVFMHWRYFVGNSHLT